MLLTAVIVVLLIWALTAWIRGPYRRIKMVEKVPGPTPILPLLGNTLQLEHKSDDFFRQVLGYCDQYKDKSSLLKVVLGTTPLIFIFRAKAAEETFKSMKNLSKSSLYTFFRPWLGTGLLTSTGEKWQSRRKLLTPTFHFKILVDFLRVFNDQSEVLINELLEKKCGSGAFDIFPFVTMCALDIICETAMGTKVNAQKTGGRTPYVDAIFGLSALIARRVRQPWKWNDYLYSLTSDGKQHEAHLKTLHSFTRKVITERRQEMELNSEEENMDEMGTGDGKKRKRAFLDLLLRMSKEAGFTDADVQEEVDTFMFEGHDTTAAGMSWVLQFVGSHPDVQRKLHEELDAVFGDSERPITADDLAKLKYLECVIKESLRLRPPVALIGRAVEQDTEIEGVTVPQGANLAIHIWKINRDPDHFDDPEKFDPDRFLPENSVGRYPFAYVPFAAGPRNCIGQRFALMEEKCVISAIFRKFKIEATQKTDDIGLVAEVIMQPKEVIVKLDKRR